MPQGRKKTPFSGKAKKQQLQSKKTRKNTSAMTGGAVAGRDDDSDDNDQQVTVKKLNTQPAAGQSSKANRYALHFQQDSKEEDTRRRELARRAFVKVPESALEVEPETPYPEELDFPRRPPWDFNMRREVLDAKENKYFTAYVDSLSKKFVWSELSYFEMNLETWRQLWRVIEMSDIVLLIVDIRFPVYLFPPSLYHYVTNTLNKDMILVLNKVDLAPAPLVLAWKHFFKSRYPALQVLLFTSFPGYNLRESTSKPGGLQVRRRRGKLRMAAEGAQQLLHACENIVQDKVDLSSWRKKIAEELHMEYEDESLEVGETVEAKPDTGYVQHERYLNGVLTIGCLGQPNVGKSSLMNSLMGKKVVSVSRTPGHTKHFQTIFLTPTVRLCDCPGLVFPSKVPKPLQVLMGSYPIAQLREPYSSIQYLAERLDLVYMLKLHHPDNDTEWSAMDVCEAWAKQRGFLTAKAARPDTYRSANHLLRMALDGKICLCLYPPQYTANKKTWEQHGELAEVLQVQAKSSGQGPPEEDLVLSSEDEETRQETPATKASPTSESEDDSPHATVATNKFALLEDDD